MASTSGPSRETSAVKTHYEILEISPAVTRQEIKDAYKRLAILKHPDKNLRDTARACIAFQQLQTAYETLSEPTLRTKYDATILRTSIQNAGRCNRPPPRATTTRPGPEQPAPPERPISPKSRFSYQDDAKRPAWPSCTWYENSIRNSVKKEKIYRDKMAAMASQNEWHLWNRLYDRLKAELINQESLRTELTDMLRRDFGIF